MATYKGAKCISCSNTFKDTDDIVVCPDCGTPYHRECYNNEGKCVNLLLHESGESWQPEYDGAFEGDAEVKCAQCGEANPPMNIFCQRCGTVLHKTTAEKPFNQNNPNGQPYSSQPNIQGGPVGADMPFPNGVGGVKFDEHTPLDDDVTIGELTDFAGSNSFYFLPQFIRFGKFGGKLSVNFTAMLFPEFYFLFRKMYAIGIPMFLLRFIASLPSLMVLSTNSNDMSSLFAGVFNVPLTEGTLEVLLGVANLVLYATMFIGGAFANYLYYKKAVKTIKAIKSEDIEPSSAKEKIKSAGGTSTVSVVAAFAAKFVLTAVFIGVFGKYLG